MAGKWRSLRFVVILIVVGVAYWQRTRVPTETEDARSKPGETAGEGQERRNPALPAEKVRGYEKFDDARFVESDGNDGDSFRVAAGGREFELRLYFVDAPEKYLSDRYESQRRRVADQARDLGGISTEAAVEVGLAAKAFTQAQLSGKPFTVYTCWEEVFDGDRYYGFVRLPDGSDLGSRLVEEGLVRIFTKGPGSKESPVPTPDGASFFEERDRLESLERQAQRDKRGAWGY